MKVSYEVCRSSTPIHTNEYVSQDVVQTITGFVSYFGYVDLQDGEIPQKNITSLYCDTIILDIDGTIETVQSILKTLDESLTGYQVYVSGSKGFHIHIPIVPLVGPQIYRYVKHFIQTRFDDVCGLDTSMVHPRGLIRLPNTVHSKTRRVKSLIMSTPGNSLEIPEYDLPDLTNRHTTDSDVEALFIAVKVARSMVFFPPKVGNRHRSLFKLSRYLLEAGLDPEDIIKIGLAVNSTWSNAKPDNEVIKTIIGAIK